MVLFSWTRSRPQRSRHGQVQGRGGLSLSRRKERRIKLEEEAGDLVFCILKFTRTMEL